LTVISGRAAIAFIYSRWCTVVDGEGIRVTPQGEGARVK
jgi:hypothetical protein